MLIQTWCLIVKKKEDACMFCNSNYMLYCIVLYCIVLYCIVLYCIVAFIYGDQNDADDFISWSLLPVKV